MSGSRWYHQDVINCIKQSIYKLKLYYIILYYIILYFNIKIKSIYELKPDFATFLGPSEETI